MAEKNLDLNEIRERINKIDDQILALFMERMRTVVDVAEYKRENNMPIFHPGRERAILERMSENAGEEMEDYVRLLYSTLFDVSRSYQARMLGLGKGNLSEKIKTALDKTPKMFPKKAIVACQGVEGAYSQQACDRLFSAANIMYFKKFEGVFNAVEQGLCKYGILPIENSTHGSVNEVYDLMKHFNFYIVKSLKLKVDHALLAKAGTRPEDINEIFSHSQAIGQCSEYLKKFPNAKITICENTAAAAKAVSESDRTDIASISSPVCAQHYGLKVLASCIQNSDANFTRFICISKEMEIYPGAEKISLMLSTRHTPGSLYSLISKFSVLGLNLTKLESRPIPGSDFEFMFYFDMEASVYSDAVLSLLDELSDAPELFVFLGSYSEV